MAKLKPLTQSIQDAKYTLAKYEAVAKAFPDARIHETDTPHSFSSKEVNQVYTKLDFNSSYYKLVVIPYAEVEFEYEGKTEMVPVYSSPKYNRLAYIPWRRSGEKIIKFSRVTFNLKNNNFKDDMLNDCRVAIMNFIKKNPGHALEEKHLEPRLKKLMLFT